LAGQAELIQLALRPLVENGLLFGPRLGMVVITVTANPEHSLWEVHDTGRRLTDEQIVGLLQTYTRSDEQVERRGSGAGMGLMLSRVYAEVLGGQVGGKVHVHGTVFWVKVPFHASVAGLGD
jgi:two-component system sensor histidine kinase KdpD